MIVPRQKALATAHDGKIHVFGTSLGGSVIDVTSQGVSEVYDPATQLWTTVDSPPVSLSGYRVTTVNDKSYFVGAGPLHVYDHAASTWSTPDTTNPLFNDTSSYLLGSRTTAGGDQLVLVQSVDETRFDGTRFFIKTYSLHANTWTLLGQFGLVGECTLATMDVIEDRAFVTLAQHRSPFLINLAGTGPIAASLPASGNGGDASAASAAIDGKVYLFGGSGAHSDGDGVGYRRESDYYDTATDTWAVVPKLLMGRERAAAVVLNGKIYVIGGRTRGGALTSRVEVFTPGG